MYADLNDFMGYKDTKLAPIKMSLVPTTFRSLNLLHDIATQFCGRIIQ